MVAASAWYCRIVRFATGRCSCVQPRASSVRLGSRAAMGATGGGTAVDAGEAGPQIRRPAEGGNGVTAGATAPARARGPIGAGSLPASGTSSARASGERASQMNCAVGALARRTRGPAPAALAMLGTAAQPAALTCGTTGGRNFRFGAGPRNRGTPRGTRAAAKRNTRPHPAGSGRAGAAGRAGASGRHVVRKLREVQLGPAAMGAAAGAVIIAAHN